MSRGPKVDKQRAMAAANEPKHGGAFTTLHIPLFASVLLLVATLGWREIATPDIGFHLNAGREIAETGTVPKLEHFVGPREGAPYVDPQWGYQLVLWRIYDLFGTAGVVASHLLLTLLTLVLVAVCTHRREGRIPAGLVILCVLWAFGNEWEPRPHVVSCLFLGWVFLALDEWSRGNRRVLWTIPPVMLVWANVHSLSILGLVAIAGHGADVAWRGLRSKQWHELRLFVVCAILAGAAWMITPYGLAGAAFPFEQWAILGTDSVFTSSTLGIAEFQSPLSLTGFRFEGRIVLLRPLLFWQLILVATAIGVLARTGRMSLGDWLRLALFGWIFLKANKNLGYFFVATAPLAAAGFSGLLAPLARFIPLRDAARRARVGRAVLVAAVVAAIPWVAFGFWYRASWSPHALGHRFNPRTLPLGAADFIRKSPSPHLVLNGLEHGGWLSFATRKPVYIDGRLEIMGAAHFQRYLATKAPATLAREMQAIAPDIVLVPLSTIPQWHEFLAGSKGWRCVYLDEWNAVYFRRSFAPQIEVIGPPSAGRDYPDFPDEAVDRILRDARAKSSAPFRRQLLGEGLFPMTSVRRSASELLRGQSLAARNLALDGIDKCPVYFDDAWINLTYAFATLGDRDRTRECLDVMREHAPGEATENLAREISRAQARR